jgi:hypothetical protein
LPVRRRRSRRKPRPWLHIEALEDRYLLATVTVTTLSEDELPHPGKVSLRQALDVIDNGGTSNPDIIGQNPGAFGVNDRVVFQAGLSGTVQISTLSVPLPISRPMTLQGLGAGSTVIKGASGPSPMERLFNITATAGDVTLDGLTLTGGSTNGDNSPPSPGVPPDFMFDGGAIQWLSNGTLTIRDCTISGNRTTGAFAGGGAIFAEGGTVAVTNSTLSGNFTLRNVSRGGAIYSDHAAVTLTHSTLSGNHTVGQNANGGGIFSAYGSVTVTYSTLYGNYTGGDAARGGGVFVRGGSPTLAAPAVTVTNSTIAGNFTRGDGAPGGGIYARNNTTVTVTDSTIVGNEVKDAAGGTNPADGGGLFVDHGTLGVFNSTISGNSAHLDGGGIEALGPTTVRSSIIALNSDHGAYPDMNVPKVTVTNSLVGNNQGTPLAPTTTRDSHGKLIADANGNLVGSLASPLDPMVGQLQNNGGPTQTLALQPGSPAIDRGANPLMLATDQRGTGFPRVVGPQADIGAFESQTVQVVNLVVTDPADRLDTTFDPNHLTLRDALTLANTNPGADTITFAPSLSGVPIRLSMGELPIADSVTIQGLGATNTTIDAQGHSRIFDASGFQGDVTLDGLTLTGGQAPGTEGGGAIVFTNFGGNNTLTVQNSILSGNASVGPGGAINASYARVLVSNSTISDNSTRGDNADGGGIFTIGVARVTGSTLARNSTQGANAHGGAVFGGVAAVLIDSTVSGNWTQGPNADGGGIATGISDVVPILYGIVLENSTVAGNSAKGPNAAGGGLASVTNMTVISSIVAQNHDSGSNPDLELKTRSGTPAATNSLIGDNTGTGLNATGPTTPDANGNVIGSAASPIDPMLGSLADNGGPTPTLALSPLSPAAGRGANPLMLATDQRGPGFPRSFAGKTDMGAFEVQIRAQLLIVNASDTLDALIDPNHLSLRDAVALANHAQGEDTITFDPSLRGVPIKLTLGELVLTNDLVIEGLGATDTVIDARQQSRIFNVSTTRFANVRLDKMTLTGGRTTAAGDAGGGGAIVFQSQGLLSVFDSIVSGNSTQGDRAEGGAIFTDRGAVLLDHSTLSDNATQGNGADGGGLSVGSIVTVIASTVAGNAAHGTNAEGGGIVADGALTVTESTVSGNSASAGGGGIVARNTLTMNNSTVAGNSTPQDGGGIVAGEAAEKITSSVVAGNTAGGKWPDLKVLGLSGLTLSHSLIGDNRDTLLTTTGLTPDANGNLIGSDASPIDPKLGPLADNGGPTLTMAPLPGSPALGRGSNPLGLNVDQRLGDFARQVNGAVDMGAIEVQPLPPPPPPPHALDDHVTLPENSGPNPIGVLANDSGSGLTVTAITQPSFGQAVILPGGIGVSYQPKHNFDSMDQLTYTVTDHDGRTASATVFVNVSGANTPPPHAQDDAVTVLDTGVNGSGQTPLDVLANDSGNHLKITAVTQPAHGLVVLDPVSGGLAYGADPGFSGTDSFTYTVQDDQGRTASANVTVTVVDTSMPTAHDDKVTVPANLPPGTGSGTTIDVLANDTGRHLLVTAVAQPAHGSAQVTPGALPVYQPNQGYVGPDSFVYTITDDKGHTAGATVSVTVVDTTKLHAQDQTATVPENGGPVAIHLMAHDTGVGLLVTGVTQPAHGTVQPPAFVGDATASYTPGPDFAGTDTFSYTVVDGNGQAATANVVVTVVGPGTPLAARDDAVAVPANSGPTPTNVLGNDSGSGVHVTAVTQGAHGTAAILAAGVGVTYQPSASFDGTDTFTYTVTDAAGQTATATVTVTVGGGVSHTPTARVTGPAAGQAGQVLTFTVSASDAPADPALGFRYVVDWGDNSPAQTVAASPGNGAGVAVSHAYAAAGSYTVRVTATNQDGTTSPVATAAVAVAMPTPPPPPPPVSVVPVSRPAGKGKHGTRRLYVQVSYADGRTVPILSPFQKPRYAAITAALADLDGDGVFDAVVFTARRGSRKVTRVIKL